MSKTVKETDESSLEQAAAVLGTENPKDTVNAALREVVRARLVNKYVTYLKERSSEELEAAREQAWH